MARKSRMQVIAEQEGRPFPDVLQDLYNRYGTQTEVARALGVSQATLNRWLLVLGLEQRTVLVEREKAS